MTLYEFSQKLLALNKMGKYQEAVSLYDANVNNFDSKDIGTNEYLISTLLSSLRKTEYFERAFEVIEKHEVKVCETSKGILINSYGWLLYSQYKAENLNHDHNQLENYVVENEDCLPLVTVKYDLLSPTVERIIEFLPIVISQANEFSYSVFSNLFTILLKIEKRRASPNWKLINDICDLVNPNDLSTECKSIEVTRRGHKKLMELASDRENWYACKTKALLQLGLFADCYNVSTVALDSIDKFHYSNDVWIARRIAISKKNIGDLHEAISGLLQVLERKKEWFIEKELAELYKENGQLEEAFNYATRAINNFGSLEYKIELIFLLGELLKLKGEDEIAYKHFCLVKLIRIHEEWSIPAKLVITLNQFDFPRMELQQIDSLKTELKKYWKTLQPNQLPLAPGKLHSPDCRQNGEIRKILHNDERGADGFLVFDGNKSTYFKINKENEVKKNLAVGMKVSFELQEVNGEKKERAVKLMKL